ncbi:MAG TPA: hypothetical protein VEH04_18030 [Verrucomicrobiae bacterium]|nr:hypothetical protein [Verrucomicrobiae bacterium]
MNNGISESVVEQCSLDWLGELGYQVLSGLTIAPGEAAAERTDYKQVFLFDRLQFKLAALNPKIPAEGLQEALRKVWLFSHPTLIGKNLESYTLDALLPKLPSGELRVPMPSEHVSHP